MIGKDQLLVIRKYTRIASHIPGRLRLKFSAKIYLNMGALGNASEDSLITDFPALISCRINHAAMSVVIEYEQDVVPYALIDDLFHTDEQLALHALNKIQGLENTVQ